MVPNSVQLLKFKIHVSYEVGEHLEKKQVTSITKLFSFKLTCFFLALFKLLSFNYEVLSNFLCGDPVQERKQ